MFRLYADVNTGFGKALLSLLKKSYPGENIDADPQAVGSKMVNIAKKQLQYSDERAQDAIQDFLEYVIKHNQDFKADFPRWQDALSALYSNLFRRAMSHSMKNTSAPCKNCLGKGKIGGVECPKCKGKGTINKRKEKSIDQAYGVRPEGGGTPEGGEAKMPTDPESSLGKALDDKAGIKEFIDVIDEHIDDLKKSLTPDSRALFDLIFEDNVGSFGSDIKENMGQASALKEKYPKMFEKNAKRWSGFVGDLRKKLLDEIWKYIDNNMEPAAYDIMKETFFGDADPTAIRQGEKKKIQDKLDYQRGIDERKIARLKWSEENGTITPKEKSSYESLKKKLTKEGVDVNAIKAEEKPAGGASAEETQVASWFQTAVRISSSRVQYNWIS